jgi:hypothetical protein
MTTSRTIMVGGERTTLALNAKDKSSLRTTVPRFMVRQWGLEKGDDLEWSFEVCKNGEQVIVIRKATKNGK